MAKRTLITEKVTELIEPVLEPLGFELVDMEYLTRHGRQVLVIYIDREGGITVDDCAMLSRELGDLIDIKEVIDHKYVLEVSSPGVDRPLKKEADFIRVIGKKVKVRMAEPVNGCRNFSGYLKDFKDRVLYLETEGGPVNLSWLEIDKANLVYEFEN